MSDLQKIVDELSGLTVLEAADLAKMLEEKWGVSAAAAAGDFRRQVRSRRRALAVTGTRQVGKRHMLYNQANPRIAIDPRTAEIRIEGEPLPPLPDDDLPLNRRYFLF